MDIDTVISNARERVLHLRARAAGRRRDGWELSDVMTPRELEVLSDEMLHLAELLGKWKSIADTREEAARINHAAYENLAASIATK